MNPVLPEQAQEALDAFGHTASWEQRARLLLQWGERLAPLAEHERQEEHRVHGCESLVWLLGEQRDGHWRFRADSDARLIRGLLAVLLARVDGIETRELARLDLNDWFTCLGLSRQLSPSRSNGLNAVLQRMRELAAPNLAIQARAGKRPQAERQEQWRLSESHLRQRRYIGETQVGEQRRRAVGRCLIGQLAPCGQLPDLQVRLPGVVAIEIQAFALRIAQLQFAHPGEGQRGDPPVEPLQLVVRQRQALVDQPGLRVAQSSYEATAMLRILAHQQHQRLRRSACPSPRSARPSSAWFFGLALFASTLRASASASSSADKRSRSAG